MTAQGTKNNGRKLTVAALAEAKQLPGEFLRSLGLSDTRRGVAIPYRSTDGAEIAVKERTALKAKEGSFWPKGVKLAAYGAERIGEANKTGFLVAVEGESDCWTLWHHGLPALGMPGAGAAQVILPEHVEMISTVYIHVEPDQGGERFLAGVLARLAMLHFKGKVFVLRMPCGVKDPSDLHCLSPDQFKAKMQEAIQASRPVELPQPNGWNGRAQVATPTAGNNGDGAGRPLIIITTEEHEVNAEAVKALTRDDAIYQRGGMLVRVVRDVSPAAKGIRRPFAPRIETLPTPLLRERLAANAIWIAVKETKEGTVEKPARPPAWCVAAVHARADWPGIRHLEAVVDYPVMRPDGTILCQPGYDPETGLLLESVSQFPSIPEQPTKADAVAALEALSEVVTDFPFEREVHRAAWLAALLTPLARFAFTGPAPLFLVDANVRAAGKGLLLDTISRIVTGERFTIATYTADEDELRKRITSLVLAGDRLVLFDNLEGKFGNAVLDAALTGTAWKDRILGVNRMAEAPLYMTWYATGNNVAVAADTARRACHVRLESPDERPEERQDFRHPNLLAWVGENRAKLLTAALTILRAYCATGRPDQGLPAWGSFEGWSALVRSAVVWVGLPDPGETRLLLQEQADLAAESMTVILACWERLDPDRRGLTAAEVINLLYKDTPVQPPEFHNDLRDALEALLGKPDSRGLGNKLRSYRRRMFQGRFIDQAGSQHRAARWAVFPAAEFRRRSKDTHQTHQTHGARGESGESGESVSVGTGADQWEQGEL
jgi:hypothetical protein